MDKAANFVSQKLDKPIMDLNGPTGQVEFHGDPARELARTVKPDMEFENGK